MAAIRGTSSGRRRNVNLIGLCAILLTFVCLHVGWPTQDFDSQPPTFKGTPDNVGVAQPSNLGERDGTPQHRDRTPLVIADGHPRDWPRASPSGDNSRSVPEGDSSKVEDKVDDSSQPQTAATTAPQVVSPPRPQRVAQTLTSTDASTAQVGSSCSVLPAVVTHKVTLERVCEGYERDPPKNDTVYLEAGPRLFHTTESLWVKWRVNGCLTNDKIALFTVDAARDGGNKNYLSYRCYELIALCQPFVPTCAPMHKQQPLTPLVNEPILTAPYSPLWAHPMHSCRRAMPPSRLLHHLYTPQPSICVSRLVCYMHELHTAAFSLLPSSQVGNQGEHHQVRRHGRIPHAQHPGQLRG